VFLIVGDGRAVLVDSGMPRNAGKILRTLQRAGLKRESLEAIVLTHWHIDHTGSAAHVRRNTGAAVYAHAADRQLVEGTVVPRLPNVATRRGRFAQWLLRKLYRRCAVDRVVGDGELLPLAGGLRVIHVKGHTAGNVCYVHEPTGSLFLGDSLMARGDEWELPQAAFNESGDDALHSLARLRDLPITACYAGHGDPVTTDAAERLRGAIDRLLGTASDQDRIGSTAAPVAK